jgi:hypothetical protein
VTQTKTGLFAVRTFSPLGVKDLQLDPGRVVWSNHTRILDYTTQALLRKRYEIKDLATKKWHLVLPTKFQFK